MAKDTDIQWCDSTNNAQMGCEGCELIKGQKVPKCYAESLTRRWAGKNKGWPIAFNQPRIFMDRVPKMVQWPDLTGTSRLVKPWLDGMPRLIFLNDMGDTFSKGMPADWFADVLALIKNSPHQYLVLTKWPHRFAAFAQRHQLPENVWPGTSITMQKVLFRISHIKNVAAPGIKWLSVEPLWGNIDFKDQLQSIDWVIVGGESGINPTPCTVDDILHVVAQCRAAGVPIFVKQLGSHLANQMGLADGHGGNWDEWPIELRIREMPVIKR
jgi:protein gp37